VEPKLTAAGTSATCGSPLLTTRCCIVTRSASTATSVTHGRQSVLATCVVEAGSSAYLKVGAALPAGDPGQSVLVAYVRIVVSEEAPMPKLRPGRPSSSTASLRPADAGASAWATGPHHDQPICYERRSFAAQSSEPYA
jgi:hypothetical protein